MRTGFVGLADCCSARNTRKRTHVCVVDIRKAFLRVRREILYLKMVRLGIPTIYIKCLSALYTDIQGSVRSSAGFCAPFRISQGTREGCILSPLIFVIFFNDVIDELQKLHFEAGHVMLGPLFADDLVLFARSVCSVSSTHLPIIVTSHTSRLQSIKLRRWFIIIPNAALRNVNVSFVMASSAEGFSTIFTSRYF